jgi:putative inorganic carbon (hco3(-)) transporter
LSETLKIRLVYIVSALFIALNTFLIVHEYYWATLIPVGLMILFLYVFSLDKLLFLIVFCTPLAINFRDFDIGIGVSLPTEPLLFGVLLFFIIKIANKNVFSEKFLKHPITITILIYLAWMLITSITSEMPLVSFKFFISKLWYIIPFYFMGVLLFKKVSNIKLFDWLYIIPLLGVITYTIIHHASFGFEEVPGHWVMTPFYNDHTAYGAVLALFIPVFIGFIFNRQFSKSYRIISLLIVAVLILAIILSFCRAAWVSLVASLFVFIVIYLKIKFRWLFLLSVVFIGSFIIFQNEIIDNLEKNKQDSSASYIEHIKSISNISSDASNLERINRWQSAIRMFNERPFWGYGPGTYQFMYAPFQRSKEKTIISTNAGDRGNAHSEYIGPLAESGVFGMLSFLAIMIAVIITGIKVYKQAEKNEIKILSLSVLLGLISYFVHGIMNNFLDTDKASVPFWGFVAMIVAMDIFQKKKAENTEKQITDKP